MTLGMFLIWILGGLLAGGLAGVVLKRGGYGLITDTLLGLGGGVLGSWVVRGIAPETGLFAMVVIAFAGAAGVIVVQRKVWPTIA